MVADTSLADSVADQHEQIADRWLRRLEADRVLRSEHRPARASAIRACFQDAVRTGATARKPRHFSAIEEHTAELRVGPCSALRAIEALATVISALGAAGEGSSATSGLQELAGRVARLLSDRLVAHTDEHERKAHDWLQEELLHLVFENQRLEQENALLAATLEQMPAGVAIADASGRLLLANSKFLHIFGDSTRRIDRIQEYDRLCGNSRPLERLLKTGKAIRHEFIELQKYTGERSVIDVSGALVRGPGFSASVALVEEATERQAPAEHAARHWDISEDLLCVISPDACFERVNPAFTRIFGYAERELLAASVVDFIHPADRQSTLLELDKSRAGHEPPRFENRCRCKDGSYKWLSWTATAAPASRVYVSARDVSDERQSRENQALLVQFAARALASFDYEATLAHLARATVPALADWCLIEVVGEGGQLRCAEIVSHDPTKASLGERLRSICPKRSDYPALIALRSAQVSVLSDATPDALRRIANDSQHLELLTGLEPKALVAVPLEVAGETLGVLTLITTASRRNLTPEDLRVARELARCAALALKNARSFAQAQRLLAFEQRLVALVSHDLRNPLNAISMTVEAMLAEHRDNTGTRELALIQRSVGHAVDLINDLLDVARAQLAGGIPLNPRPTNLSELVASIVEEARASHPGARIDVQADEDVTGTWDANRVAQVIANLLVNALIHGVTDSVATVRLQDLADQVELAVHNFGETIAPRDQDTLFEAMRQGSGAVPQGLGLGLFIVKQIVDAHGGNIQIESNAEQGTTFRVRLPKSAAQSSEIVNIEPTAS